MRGGSILQRTPPHPGLLPDGEKERELKRHELTTMLVKLIRHTPEPEKSCAVAARLCYSNTSIGNLQRKFTRPLVQDLLKKIVRSGHLSVLEHASFTFAVEGVSRALLAQLTRHRIASFSVQSQRYVKFSDKFEFVTPPTIARKREIAEAYALAVNEAKKLYDVLLLSGIPAEDARYVIPQAAATKIILTMNARELRHFFSLRCCNRAQWEIRAMAVEMLALARRAAPLLFRSCGPSCVSGACSEDKPCGKPWKKVPL